MVGLITYETHCATIEQVNIGLHMSLELTVFISPLIGVLVFFMIEMFFLKMHSTLDARVKVILGLEAVDLTVSFLLSLFLLVPLVFLIAGFQVFSLSNWQVPQYVSFTASILLLDFVYYLNHRLNHKVALLWRLHRLHHTDREIDSLTTFLHHPFEVISSFVVIVFFSVIFDIPTIALLVYGLLVGIHSGFTHLNYLLPERLNHYLKFFIVTPNFHRVHHSLDMKESNSNFGMVLTLWDHLLKTVCLKQFNQSSQMKFGVDNYPKIAKLDVCFKNPVC